MTEAMKLLLQGAFAIGFVALLASPWTPLPAREALTLHVPFVKTPIANSAALYLPLVFVFVMLVGNAVNITDGLDGLAIVPSVFVIGVLGFFAYIMGNVIWARVPHLPAAAGSRRADRVLRGVRGRRHRLPLVQRLPGADLHGRRRLAGDRRVAWRRSRCCSSRRRCS